MSHDITGQEAVSFGSDPNGLAAFTHHGNMGSASDGIQRRETNSGPHGGSSVHERAAARSEADAGQVRSPGAIIIGGDYRGLGVVRSLGRQGIPVWVLTDEQWIAATSRYARARLPWPKAGEEQQVQYLMRVAAQRGLDGWLLYPTGDQTAATLARHHQALSTRFRLTVPPWETLRWAYDKRLTYQLADEQGVDYPWTYYPVRRDEVERLGCSFPVILKPATKQGSNPFVHAKAWQVGNRDELLARYDEACRMVDPSLIMIQELIPGGGAQQLSYAALCREGLPVASVVVRRLRQYPVDFGRSSSYVETIEAPDVEEVSRRLLDVMHFTGLVEVEFKRDQHGRIRLLDINPRIWGWHSIGRRAGVDFPFLAWKMIRGDQLPEVRARVGVRWIRRITDLAAAAEEIRRGILTLPGYLDSLRARDLESAMLAADDPLPGLVEVPLFAYRALRRGAARMPVGRSHSGNRLA